VASWPTGDGAAMRGHATPAAVRSLADGLRRSAYWARMPEVPTIGSISRRALPAACLAAVLVGGSRLAWAQAEPPVPPPASQNPSPMVETTRTHERLRARELGGTTRSFPGPGGRPVELWIPESAQQRDAVDLIVHFHGAAWIPQQAAAGFGRRLVVAVLNLGAGAGVYDRSFADPAAFDSLLAAVERDASPPGNRPLRVGRVTLTAYSAGHGAVRAILRDPRHFERVSAVLLLDGMHTSYVPDRRVMADGGTLDTTNLAAFANFARAAMRGDKRFLVTHSEIFPGTFASTTETADWMLGALALRRAPVLRWGPRGMQQLSDVSAVGFLLHGYAGNTAPDHVDHLHAMPELLARLLGR
jgi:hypothetical protein